jgi:hypothetical protein
MMFLDCPAYLGDDRATRCGLPAEVRCRFTMRSTDGPIECAMIRCPAGHWFNGAIESLTWDGKHKHDPRTAAPTSASKPDIVQGSPVRRDGCGVVVPEFPDPGPRTWRPNTAPAYYLGRPANVWITALRPRRSRNRQARPIPRKATTAYGPGMAARSHPSTVSGARGPSEVLSERLST